MLIECPHCHVRVDPQHQDGVCGMCGKNVNDVDGINPNRGLLVLRLSARMPELCCHCGIPTSEMTEFQLEPSDDSVAVNGVMAAPMLGPFVQLMNFLRNLATTKSKQQPLTIPLCGFCQDKPFDPIPVHPSDELFQCSVHIDFKNRYDVLNPTSGRF